jgi:hypothetical protein
MILLCDPQKPKLFIFSKPTRQLILYKLSHIIGFPSFSTMLPKQPTTSLPTSSSLSQQLRDPTTTSASINHPNLSLPHNLPNHYDTYIVNHQLWQPVSTSSISNQHCFFSS